MQFSRQILDWYRVHKRVLPWRSTRDPYHIWLSEIMLQQTRVAQGLPYYLRFTERFPRVEDLAGASEEEVLKLWQGLGYYSRARNLHQTARIVSETYGGQFPGTYKELLGLKGIGPYTAAAIASICFGLPHPVVDGNVYRVLSRFFGVHLEVNSTEGIRYFAELAQEVMDREYPGEYNQGLMEFGALQCAPQNPDCGVCPLADGCVAREEGLIQVLPKKRPKKKERKRFFNYLMPVDPGFRTQLTQRKGPGIWQGLYEFPLIESDREIDDEEIVGRIRQSEFHEFSDAGAVVRFNPKPLVHKLSHQHLYVTFWIVRLECTLREAIPVSQMQEYPVPVLIANFMETVKNSYF